MSDKLTLKDLNLDDKENNDRRKKEEPSTPPRRRKIQVRKIEDSQVVTVPKLESLMTDALSIIGAELAHYRSKSGRGVTLDLKEARVIQAYMDSLVKMSKEAREQARAEDLSDLSNEELLQLATELNKKAGKAPRDDED